MKSLRLSPARKAHLRGLARVTAYVSTLTLIASAFSVRAARAGFQERSVDIGRQMTRLVDATQNDVNKVSMNGQPMWVGSALAESSVSGVLDRYEAYCKANGAHPVEEWQRLAKDQADAKVKTSLMPTGILRGGDAHEGAVLCFTKGELTKPSFTEALKAFQQTGELGTLGALRYAYAKTTDKGNTLVLTAWTDDRFNVGKLVPEEGKDVAGYDFPEIPRAPGSERVLSTHVEGSPFGMNVYRSKAQPSEIASFYDKAMTDKGWSALAAPIDDKTEDGKPVLARLYERDGVVLTMASHVDEGASFTALGLAGVSAEVSPELNSSR